MATISSFKPTHWLSLPLFLLLRLALHENRFLRASLAERTILLVPTYPGQAEGQTRGRNVAGGRIARGLALGTPVAGVPLAAWITARRITAPGSRVRKFVMPWELGIS